MAARGVFFRHAFLYAISYTISWKLQRLPSFIFCIALDLVSGQIPRNSRDFTFVDHYINCIEPLLNKVLTTEVCFRFLYFHKYQLSFLLVYVFFFLAHPAEPEKLIQLYGDLLGD